MCLLYRNRSRRRPSNSSSPLVTMTFMTVRAQIIRSQRSCDALQAPSVSLDTACYIRSVASPVQKTKGYSVCGECRAWMRAPKPMSPPFCWNLHAIAYTSAEHPPIDLAALSLRHPRSEKGKLIAVDLGMQPPRCIPGPRKGRVGPSSRRPLCPGRSKRSERVR
jgi:hypothetical protein